MLLRRPLVLLALPPLLLLGGLEAQEPPRLLFIGLDAVPFRTVERLSDPALGDAALFRGLRGPVPLISTFPSTTSLAFAGILEPLGLQKSPGYEAKFFDWDQGRVRGGGLISYNRIKFPWREFWDWKMRGLGRKLVSGARPVKTTYRSIRQSLAAFAAGDDDVFFIYYTTTDLVAHLDSPPGLEPVLRRLDEGLRELRRRPGARPFRVVLFSDHGMDGGEPLVNVRQGVKRALKDAGYHPARRLRHADHVVFVPFGLVSSFVAFTRDEVREKVAEVMAAAEGVHVCATPATSGDGVRVFGGGASALVRRTGPEGQELWSYEPLDGDPLELAPVVAGLRRRAHDDQAAAFPDRWWLEATRERENPDPLYRIVRGFDLVENPASVICGTRPGFMYGACSTELASRLSVGRLRWTHGALDKEASLGFLMSDVETWEVPSGPVRFNEALLPFLRDEDYRKR
jgi:hypothetical protein